MVMRFFSFLLLFLCALSFSEWRIPVEDGEFLTPFSRNTHFVSIGYSEENTKIYPIASGRVLKNFEMNLNTSTVTNVASTARYQTIWIAHDNGFASVYSGNMYSRQYDGLVNTSDVIAEAQEGESIFFGVYDLLRKSWINPYYIFPDVRTDNADTYDIVLRSTNESMRDRDVFRGGSLFIVRRSLYPLINVPIVEQLLVDDTLQAIRFNTYIPTRFEENPLENLLLFSAPHGENSRVTILIRSFYSEKTETSQQFFYRVSK